MFYDKKDDKSNFIGDSLLDLELCLDKNADRWIIVGVYRYGILKKFRIFIPNVEDYKPRQFLWWQGGTFMDWSIALPSAINITLSKSAFLVNSDQGGPLSNVGFSRSDGSKILSVIRLDGFRVSDLQSLEEL